MSTNFRINKADDTVWYDEPSDDSYQIVLNEGTLLFDLKQRESMRYGRGGEGSIKGVLPPNVAWVSPSRDRLIMVEPPTSRMLTVRLRTALVCECEWGHHEVEECSQECAGAEDHCGCGFARGCCEKHCTCEGEEYKISECALCLGEDSYDNHKGEVENEEWGKYYLALPYLVYVIDVSGTEVTLQRILAATEAPNLDTPLSSVPVPNLYIDGTICAGTGGTVFVGDYRKPLQLVEAVSSVIDGFWSSAFNFDVMNYKDMATWKELVSNVEEYWLDAKVWEFWESLSNEELMDLLPWEQDAQTFMRSLIQSGPSGRRFRYGKGKAFRNDLSQAVAAARLSTREKPIGPKDHDYQLGEQVVITGNDDTGLAHYFDVGTICTVVAHTVHRGRHSCKLRKDSGGGGTQYVYPNNFERVNKPKSEDKPQSVRVDGQITANTIAAASISTNGGAFTTTSKYKFYAEELKADWWSYDGKYSEDDL